MSTSTARLALTKPATSDSMATGATVLSANYDIIDGAVGAPTFTSGTRPGAPWQGRIIFESDTSNLRYWDGTKWSYWGNNNVGRRTVTTVNGTGSATFTTEALRNSVTFSATQNRRYRIQYCSYGEHTTNVNGSFKVRLRWATGSSVATTDTLIRETVVKCNSVGSTGMQVIDVAELDYTAADATITVGAFYLDGGANTISINANVDGTDVIGTMDIRDWGVH